MCPVPTSSLARVSPSAPEPIEIDTPHGPARVRLHPATTDPLPRALVLGHGAGGGVDAPDLRAATDVATSLGWAVALVEQPYRVAGRRAPAPATQLDVAWTAVLATLRAGPLAGSDVVTGGRSSGARVACRTASATGSVGVLCLAFPLHPPGRADDPTKSRLPELDGVDVPVLVVQGESDPFGVPPDASDRDVVQLRGNHSLRSDMPGLRSALERWLVALLPAAPTPAERGSSAR